VNFAAKMAWRDFKARPSRYVFHVLTVALGTMSLFAVESFRAAISNSINAEGRALLGADVRLQSIRPFTQDQAALVNTWPGEHARLISYRTMIRKPGTHVTRLVEVQAFERHFPFYGRIETEPVAASDAFQAKQGVLLDQVLALQLNVSPGDLITLSGQDLRVCGVITRTPGEIPARSLIAPRIFIPLDLVDQQRMAQPGVMARFEYYLASRGGADAADFVARARAAGLNAETVKDRQADLLGNTDRLSRYLGLIGFAALAISCLGIMGAVYFFISAKRQAVAQLRCIGCSIWTASAIFFIQLAAIAFAGSFLGILTGLGAASLLPRLFSGFLPVAIDMQLQASPALLSFCAASWFTIISGMLPILSLRDIPPVYSLRNDTRTIRSRAGFIPELLLILMLAGSFLFFSTLLLGTVRMASIYLAGMMLIMAILAGTGWVVRKTCVTMIRRGWNYPARLAISGMYRPQNQTLMLVVCIGLGLFFVNTVDVLERHIVGDLRTLGQNRPNLAMIDIQPDQEEQLTGLLNRYRPASVFSEPMITMRLVSINDESLADLSARRNNRPEEWALKREFRTTYRNAPKPEIESVIAGEWVSRIAPGQSPVPVSLEEGIADALNVGLGDRILFDIHGVALETRVANLRKADWKSMQPNFFIVFPEGVIDDAPQSILVFCNISNMQQRAEFQARMVEQFPNVTAIDISLMMNAVMHTTRQLSAGIKTIAVVTLLAGLAVMMAIIRSGRMVRLREAILLRTIGSSARTIVIYQVLELVFLALIATASGLVLSILTSWAIVHYGLDFSFDPGLMNPWPFLFVLHVIVIATGLAQAAGALRLAPAEAWRSLSIASS